LPISTGMELQSHPSAAAGAESSGVPGVSGVGSGPQGSESSVALYDAYRRELVDERMAIAVRSSIIMGFTIQNGFLVLDYLTYPELFAQFFAIRMAINAVFAVLYFLTMDRFPRASMLATGYALGFGMLAMIYGAGATSSPYYTGLILVFFGIGVMLPLSGLEMALVSGSLALAFTIGPLFEESPEWGTFGLHAFFTAAAAAETVFCASFLDRMRFTEFRQRQQLVEAQEHLEEMDRVKSRFTANVHHELRTPLTLTLAPLEGMLSGEFGVVPDSLRGTLKTMHSNGLRLLKLINNLLDLAKIEGAQLEIHRRRSDLGLLVGALVDGARPLAARKGVELTASGFADLSPICVDPEAIEKVIVNLVGNALKFTEERGRIDVMASLQADGGVQLVVKDEGAGIPPAQLSRIFDRFAQVDGSTTRRHEGTGIGLSLVKELVELHGGRVWAESEGLGFGTKMFVVLPPGEADDEEEELFLETDSEARAAKAMAGIESDVGLEEDEAGDGSSADLSDLERHVARTEGDTSGDVGAPEHPDGTPEVLIVEDNPDMRKLLRFLVSKEFRVRTARNGREGLEAVQAKAPDLVLTDVMMPEMSGTELCAAIKQDPVTSRIPVALVTSKADREMKIEGLELGADDYVTKPFHPRELMARVRSLVRLYRLQSELGERNVELEDSNGRLAQSNEELEVAMRELREAEEHLVESERRAALGELAAGVAHEVNNPVNFALNALRNLQRQVEDVRTFATKLGDATEDANPAQRLRELERLSDELAIEDAAEMLTELVEIANDGLERTHRLVGGLRDFAAPSRGPHERVDLELGLRSTIQLVCSGLPPNVEVHTDFPAESPAILGDRAALNQVFLNLLKNAAEALVPDGGRIEVALKVVEAFAVIEIRDDGPGMSSETLERLFEPFYTTKEAGKGTGLGLSISRRIAREQNGDLEAGSELGEGSVFSLRIPISD